MAIWRNVSVVFACAVIAGGVGAKLMRSSVTNEKLASNPDAMVRITPQRITMAPRIRTLCFQPQAFGPHERTDEILIYANQIALDYRQNHPKGYEYPVGSKFVKEKYAHLGDAHPDAATIMERNSMKGDVSDWSFSMVSLPDKTPLKPIGQVTCAECHQGYKDTGYISTDSEAALRQHLGIK